jgi:glucose-1-phosphate cytidylyltransferase
VKAVILAGGYGTRISEESSVKPKPMVEIGSKPILWHIMKIYSAHGVNEFIICCGYKGYVIKEYFANYFLHLADITFDIRHNNMEVLQNNAEPWKVTVVDTGETTMTGGRLKRIRKYIGEETFCLTYGDGLSDVDIQETIKFHHEQKVLVTLTAVQPPGRFGAFTLAEGEMKVSHFREKPRGDGAWVSGGFFIMEPEAINYVSDDTTVWEQEPMAKIADANLLAAYRHYGFWHPMDTLRDKHHLEKLWTSAKAPWKVW